MSIDDAKAPVTGIVPGVPEIGFYGVATAIDAPLDCSDWLVRAAEYVRFKDVIVTGTRACNGRTLGRIGGIIAKCDLRVLAVSKRPVVTISFPPPVVK